MKGHPAPEGQPVEQLVVAKDREGGGQWFWVRRYRQRWSTPRVQELLLEAPGSE